MKKIILISGKSSSGKDTLANMLKEKLEKQNQRVVVDHFARFLKDMCKIYCNWNGEKDEYGRSLLQKIGTDIIRHKFEMYDFHVGRVCEDIMICQEFSDYILIPDCRFPNEIELPKQIFGDRVITIRVERPGYHSRLTEEQQNHMSEIALDDHEFDFNISAKDLKELEEKIEDLLKNI